MQVHFWDDDNNAGLQVRQHNSLVTARRTGERIAVTIATARSTDKECGGVDAEITVCFTCEEFERLVCELSRIECGVQPCAPCGLFDQDRHDDECCDDDDDDDKRERSVEVNVGELRAALKGLRSDETIRVSE